MPRLSEIRGAISKNRKRMEERKERMTHHASVQHGMSQVSFNAADLDSEKHEHAETFFAEHFGEHVAGLSGGVRQFEKGQGLKERKVNDMNPVKRFLYHLTAAPLFEGFVMLALVLDIFCVISAEQTSAGFAFKDHSGYTTAADETLVLFYNHDTNSVGRNAGFPVSLAARRQLGTTSDYSVAESYDRSRTLLYNSYGEGDVEMTQEQTALFAEDQSGALAEDHTEKPAPWFISALFSSFAVPDETTISTSRRTTRLLASSGPKISKCYVAWAYDWHHFFVTLSKIILTFFIVEISAHVYVNGPYEHFFVGHGSKFNIAGHWIDALVVPSSWLIEFFFEEKFNGIGFLIFLRLWRVIRIIAGFYLSVSMMQEQHHAYEELAEFTNMVTGFLEDCDLMNKFELYEEKWHKRKSGYGFGSTLELGHAATSLELSKPRGPAQAREVDGLTDDDAPDEGMSTPKDGGAVDGVPGEANAEDTAATSGAPVVKKETRKESIAIAQRLATEIARMEAKGESLPHPADLDV
ncbi:unnamed protein product [Amoebophrya sp. A120]|nr:unnamed protein product [Amoebophrya sp. A120]|eukprot:GSA120T00012348001.1